MSAPVLTTEQCELIERTLQRIENRPDLLDMWTWGYGTECGTVACLAGHLALEGGVESLDDIDVASMAGGLIGLLVCDSRRLFHEAEWPERFGSLYAAADDQQAKAGILRERVTHWMETGE